MHTVFFLNYQSYKNLHISTIKNININRLMQNIIDAGIPNKKRIL